MFKKIVVVTSILAITCVLILGAVNRTLAKTGSESASQGANRSQGAAIQVPAEQTERLYTQGTGNGAGGSGAGAQAQGNLPAVTGGDLSEEEAAALLFMREEEKLAHDVYLTLYEEWGLPIFQNISQSEQAHMEAIKTLLDRYGLQDPASNPLGVFTNPDLQRLYDELAARGGQSLADALKVGAAIEEIDILDLQERLAQSDKADIQQVFNNLLKGSQNHLRSFVSTLSTQSGETYQPQYLEAQAYQDILGAQSGRGAGGNGGGWGGQGRQGG